MLQMITVEKYVNNSLQERFSVPIAVVRVLGWLLPQKAKQQLYFKGLDIDALLMAGNNAENSDQWFDAIEKGVLKQICVKPHKTRL